MTGSKGVAMVVIGILIFSGTCIYASDVYSRSGDQATSELDANARQLMATIMDTLAASGPKGTIDPTYLMTVEADGLATEGDFQLEVIDVSGYEVTYSRSIALGNQIQTSTPPAVVEEGQMVTIHSAASIFVGPDEVHGARLVLRHWEG